MQHLMGCSCGYCFAELVMKRRKGVMDEAIKTLGEIFEVYKKPILPRALEHLMMSRQMLCQRLYEPSGNYEKNIENLHELDEEIELIHKLQREQLCAEQ